MVRMRRLTHLHPFFFLLASMLYLYRRSAVVASPEQIVRPLLVLSALVLALAWLPRQRTHDQNQMVAVLLSVFVLSICSSPAFFLGAGASALVPLLLAWIVTRLCQQRLTVTHASAILTGVSLFLSAIFTVPLVRILAVASAQAEGPAASITELRAADPPPDIYYISLDAYGRADVLADLYGFDNSEFVRFLESRGFVVPAESRSNYPKTILSIASTLNMDYVDSLQPGLNVRPYWWLVSRHLDRSRVRLALENIGYQSVSLATGWSLTDNPTTDVYYSRSPVALTDFESFFLASTPLRAINSLFERFELAPTYSSHRAAILYSLDTLARIPAEPAPTFVFTHVFAGHPPFVLDANGRSVQPAYAFSFSDAEGFPLSDDEYRDGYVKQVQFINKKLMSLVDTILRESETPPIIILQADHGPRMFSSFQSYESTCLKEQFSIFSAYYLPGVQRDAIPDNLSSVNLFRMIFNRYFDSSLPLLESRNFYGDSRAVLVDVTDRIDSCSSRGR